MATSFQIYVGEGSLMHGMAYRNNIDNEIVVDIKVTCFNGIKNKNNKKEIRGV